MKNQKGFSLIELLIVVAIILIIAAIAIPGLLAARIAANESATVGDHRTVSTGMVAYSSANAGFYDQNISCLATPGGGACIPSYPANGPKFLDLNLATVTLTKSGYTRTHTPGSAPTTPPPVTASASSAVEFCYEGVPATVNRTGRRAFAIDSSGQMCVTNNGVAIGCTAAGMPATCIPLAQ